MSAMKPTVNDDELPNPELPGKSEIMATFRGFVVSHVQKRGAYHIVFDVLDPIGDLHDAVGYPKPVLGKVRHRQRDRIDVLVDGGSEHAPG